MVLSCVELTESSTDRDRGKGLNRHQNTAWIERTDESRAQRKIPPESTDSENDAVGLWINRKCFA
jgi:hypothetical protein